MSCTHDQIAIDRDSGEIPGDVDHSNSGQKWNWDNGEQTDYRAKAICLECGSKIWVGYDEDTGQSNQFWESMEIDGDTYRRKEKQWDESRNLNS